MDPPVFFYTEFTFLVVPDGKMIKKQYSHSSLTALEQDLRERGDITALVLCAPQTRVKDITCQHRELSSQC